MVRFLYYQDLPSSMFNLKEQGVDLLKLADRFACTDLKMHIEADLVDSGILKVDNVAEFLLLADAHSCALLKEAAIDFIVQNLAEATKTDGWANLAESAALLNEVFQTTAGNARGGKVSVLRKRLADQGQDVDGTKETLIKRLRA